MGVLLVSLVCLFLAPLQEPEVRARFTVEPLEVEVGQPFQLTLEVEHPSSLALFDLELNELELDPSWVLFDEGRETAEALAASPGRSVTRWRWELGSLEAGERRLLDALISLVSDERVTAVDASATSISVRSLLAEGEDQPRPLRGLPAGFGELPDSELSAWERAWPGLLAFGVLCAGLICWRRWRGRAPERVAKPLAPLAELEELRAAPASEQLTLQARHFALTRLVRRATDEKRGMQREGLTDEEWLAEIEASLAGSGSPTGGSLGGLVADLKQYLQAAEAIKYARSDASDWALEETYEATRRILERLRQEAWPQAAREELTP